MRPRDIATFALGLGAGLGLALAGAALLAGDHHDSTRRGPAPAPGRAAVVTQVAPAAQPAPAPAPALAPVAAPAASAPAAAEVAAPAAPAAQPGHADAGCRAPFGAAPQGPPQAAAPREALLARLSTVSDDGQRQAALEALSAYALEDVPGAREALLDAFDRARDPGARAAALYALREAFPEEPALLDRARQALATSDDPHLLTEAADVVMELGDEAAAAELRAAARRTTLASTRQYLREAAEELAPE